MESPDPPRLSVVVCVCNIEGFVAECIESLLSQDFDDFEIIAVDDCSTDSSGAVLDDLAAGNSRLRVVHLEENVGLGMARNAGLRRARGDYVLFLDGDDMMTPGSLTAIASRLTENADPDVLLYDYERLYWWGDRKRNRLSRLLTEAGTRSFGLGEHPGLLRIFPVAWNKAYRRDFLDTLRLEFTVGYYEDVSWTLITMIRATRISALDRVCVQYRQRRFGGILQTQTTRHSDVLTQYEAVFSHLEDLPSLEDRWASSVHRQMVNHLLSIWEHPKRLPADYRPEFFRIASQRSRERLPSRGFEFSNDRRQAVKQWLLLHGRRRTLTLLQRLARTVRAVRRRGFTLRRRSVNASSALRRRCLELYYRWQLRLPIDPQLAVYSAYWNAGYQCSPRAIYEKAAEIVPDTRGVWVIRETGHPAPRGTVTVRPGTRAYWKALARARVLVNNVNFPDEVVKRPGTTHLQTQHGTPLKYMGIDLRDRPVASGGTNMGNLLRRSDRWDFNLSANPHSSRVWRRAFPCDYEMLELGSPRNDRLVTATAADTATVRRQLGVSPSGGTDKDPPPAHTVILYAPTHREFDRSFVPPLDVDRFAKALGPDYSILLRAHHRYSPGPRTGPGGIPNEAVRDTSPPLAARVVDVSRYPTIEDLCIAADVLITDYSSVMFDFANLRRPIVLFTPDWDAYRMVRGVYFDVVSAPPGVVTEDPEHLVTLIRSNAHTGALAWDRLDEFRRRFCPFDDGSAAERVVRRVFLGEDPPSTL